MSKHAYLIMAHRDDYTFYSLLRMIDHEKNDIYIHMDVKNLGFDEDYAKSVVKKSGIFFSKRTNVTWGGYSVINAELILLKCATKNRKYLYYHLLSGQDLPIQTQTDIHNFFESHYGTEFVRFQNNKFKYYDRVKYYYFLQERMGRKSNFVTIGLKAIQMALGVRRNKNILFQKGSNWFSITDNLARYTLSKEEWIRKTFKYTVCCDEIFLQTIIINSDFKNYLVKTDFDDELKMSMRMIDWTRGNPYIFRIEDLDMLEQSEMMFARKFSAETDKRIIKHIVAKYK